jgi:hypothetical protein
MGSLGLWLHVKKNDQNDHRETIPNRIRSQSRFVSFVHDFDVKTAILLVKLTF